MMFLQQSAGRPGCTELQDHRHPQRLRALRGALAASVLGWLAFAAALSARPDDAQRLVAAEAAAAPAPMAPSPPVPAAERAVEPVVAVLMPEDLDAR